MTDIWPVIHTERQALADDLQNLDEQQWQAPSLCTRWTAHDVLAHMLATAKMTPPQFFLGFAGTGFNFDKFADKNIKREGAGGPQATLTAFRAAQNRTSAPPGPKDTWLGETLVHSEDIRRPLGIKHEYPLPFVTRVIRLYARSNALIGGRNRVAGLTLRATDTDFSLGSGPLVEGPAVALMLATAGRESALSQLTGEGLPTLNERSGGAAR
ncbi:MAG TPA: maleylpyruvate isomerase family mycothiol-dependent enzyme [Jatrophihabitans sp.]|nr:maleylpyruvate isomerase family mycothiol-dependent enzyme [Jatrophihabitans sp.]